MPADRGSIGAVVPLSIDAARRDLAQAFRQQGLDAPELDARLLVGHALGLDHTALVSQSDRRLAVAETDAIAALAARRLRREPVARILGEKEFWGLRLRLEADALVPRPETETVVEAALEALDRRNGRQRPLRVADLGTGSGALLLALLSELPQARGVGTDLSLAALACARRNAGALAMAERVSLVACDYGSALAGPFDVLVSNPPYVRRGDIATLAPEGGAFDPARALDGGADGLDGYRAIAADARRLISPNGILVVELGDGQLAAATALFDDAGCATMASRNDLSGVARALIIEGPP